jgi:hypothetical protein
MSKGGQVNSTCCHVHKNAEFVPDRAGIHMYVRTTRQVRVDSEILVMYQPDRGFFGGVQGRCRCCLCEKCTPECCTQGSDVLHRWAQWGASGVPVFEGANKLVLIRNVQCACCSLKHVCHIHLLYVDICNMHVDICNMHVHIRNMHVGICDMHVYICSHL